MITWTAESPPGVESAFKAAAGEFKQGGSTAPIAYFIREQKPPRHSQHTVTYISLAKLYLNTRHTKKMSIWVGTLSPQTKSGFS